MRRIVAGLAALLLLAAASPAAASTPKFLGIAAGWPYEGTVAEWDAQLDHMVAVGAKAVRVDIPWQDVEPSPGRYDWTLPDLAVTHAAAHGLAVLGILDAAPAWAVNGTTINAARFGAFARAAVAHYPQVGGWEIWNEENIPAFWPGGPDPAGYAALVTAANLPALTSRPVVLGGLAPAPAGPAYPSTFLDAVLARTKPGTFTAIGVHPYDQQLTLPDAKRMVSTVRDVMTKRGVAGKELWATEAGVFSGTGGVTEQQQADILRATIRWWASLPYVGPMFIYTTRDTTTDGGRAYGLYRADWTPKPAATVFDTP